MQVMIIKVDCRKAPELCRFAETYVYPEKNVSIDEYRQRINRFSKDLVTLLYYRCDYVFEEECPVNVNEIYEEIINIFLESEEFTNLVEKLNITEFSDEPRDDHITLDNKIKIYPILKLQRDGYEIFFEVEY